MFMRAGTALARRCSSAFQTADVAGGYRESGMPNRHRGWSRDGAGNLTRFRSIPNMTASEPEPQRLTVGGLNGVAAMESGRCRWRDHRRRPRR